MRPRTGLLFIVTASLLLSCASRSPQSGEADRTVVSQTTNIHKSANTDQYPVAKKTTEWEEYSEEDRACEADLDEAIICFSLACKRGLILSLQKDFTVCLQMHKDRQGQCRLNLLRMVSTPGDKPVQTGELLQEYTLPTSVIFVEDSRFFWYDKQGNIDFFEPDQILRTFDNPPRGDVVFLPKNQKIPRRAVVDVAKHKTELQYYQYLIAQ
jgi:uncharacterized protein YcfL